MQNNVIGNILDKTLENLRRLVDENTVIGTPITAPDGSTVIPVSRISVGMVSGGGEYGSVNPVSAYPGAGGGGAGLTVCPLGFLVLNGNRQNFIKVDKEEAGDKWINLMQVVGKVFSKSKKE